MRTLGVLLSVAVLALAAGCKGNCRQLAEKLCECKTNSTEKNSCLTAASQDESSYPPDAEQDQTCGALLEQCDCRLIDTPEGRVRCGLSRPPLDGGS